jgi:hypothetical protein
VTDQELLKAIARLIWDPRQTRAQMVAKIARLLADNGYAPTLIGIDQEND